MVCAVANLKVINTKNAAHYRWGNGADGWHLLLSEELSVIEESVPPYESEERHYHQHAQQFFYVLSGVAHLEISGEEYELQPGNGIHVPNNTPHQLMNKNSKALRFLVISQPRSHGDSALA